MKIEASGNEETSRLIYWNGRNAELRESSGGDSVGNKVPCPTSVQDNRLRDGAHRKSIQGIDAASMTKGLCNDVVLNY